MITGKKIFLRAIEPTHVDLMYRWENDLTIWPVSGTLTPFSRTTVEQFVNMAHQDIYTNKQLRLMIDLKYFDEADEDETTRSIGCVDLFDFDPKNKRAGIGILIADKADRGRGYATEALHLIMDYGFEVLDLHQIYSNIRVENESSVSLFKRAGFEVTGLKQDWIYEQGKFYDEYTLQLIKK